MKLQMMLISFGMWIAGSSASAEVILYECHPDGLLDIQMHVEPSTDKFVPKHNNGVCSALANDLKNTDWAWVLVEFCSGGSHAFHFRFDSTDQAQTVRPNLVASFELDRFNLDFDGLRESGLNAGGVQFPGRVGSRFSCISDTMKG